jgi:hypothetical protein
LTLLFLSASNHIVDIDLEVLATIQFRIFYLPISYLARNLKVKTYKIVILAVVLCGYETWPLTIKVQYKLRVFVSKVLRRIFGPKRMEVTRGWRKSYNEEVHNLYSVPGIISVIKLRMRWAGHVACMGQMHCQQDYG